MSKRKFGDDVYAVTMWKPEDIESLRPGWDFKKCEEWLAANERYIADRLIELGWDVIETLLPPEEERSCATCCWNDKGCCNYDGDCDGITHPKWNRNCGKEVEKDAPIREETEG